MVRLEHYPAGGGFSTYFANGRAWQPRREGIGLPTNWVGLRGFEGFAEKGEWRFFNYFWKWKNALGFF